MNPENQTEKVDQVIPQGATISNLELKQLAARLPKMIQSDAAGNPIYITRTFKGMQLLNQGIKKVDGKDGKVPVVEGKSYVTRMPHYVDHYKEMKRLKRSGGVKKVMAYFMACQKVPLQDKRVKKSERRKVQNPLEVKTVRTVRPTFKQRMAAFFKILKREILNLLKRKSNG